MAVEPETTEAEIVAAADKITKGQRYEVWTVGVTDNVDLRREEHGRPTIWHVWHAENEQTAKNVEKALQGKGMKAYTGNVGEGAHSVYITWA